LGYFAVESFLLINTYGNYDLAAVSLPFIVRRRVISMVLGILYYHSYSSKTYTYICSTGIEDPLFEFYYYLSLHIEEQISKYQKSSKSIYSKYKDKLDFINSENMCTMFRDQESK